MDSEVQADKQSNQTCSQNGSMRQNSDMPTIQKAINATTCGFLTRKRRCARRFQNLQHTSAKRFRKCGDNQDWPSSPLFYVSTTCGFVGKNRVALGGFRFFPRPPRYDPLESVFQPRWRHPRQHPVVAETSRGRCRKTGQRPFFVSASRRVHGDCITENI